MGDSWGHFGVHWSTLGAPGRDFRILGDRFGLFLVCRKGNGDPTYAHMEICMALKRKHDLWLCVEPEKEAIACAIRAVSCNVGAYSP